MLHRCGLIARPEVHETTGLKLTGEHAGSTKKIVEEHLDKAKGGVLFIDEVSILLIFVRYPILNNIVLTL